MLYFFDSNELVGVQLSLNLIRVILKKDYEPFQDSRGHKSLKNMVLKQILVRCQIRIQALQIENNSWFITYRWQDDV